MGNDYSENIKLISDYLLGEITDADYQKLLQWVKESEEHKKVFEDCFVRYKQARQLAFTSQINHEQAWTTILKKAKRSKKHQIKQWISYAAAILIPLAIGVSLFVTNYSFEKTNQEVLAPIIEPGGNKAILLTATGQQYELDSAFVMTEKDGTLIENQSKGIVYSENKVKPSTPVLNTIYIPRKGEFQLQLSDGTKVWLNSDTKMVYPTSFTEDKREVSIEGEAFFEVKHDPKRPFLVKTQQTTIEVLGTSFNIKAYSDEESTAATLVEGKVKLRNLSMEEKYVYLLPGQQANLKKGESQIQINQVDTKLYTSWKDGMFIFENMPLDQIMTILSRWYNVEVSFENPELKKLHFSGDLERYKNINPHLDMISLTAKVSFVIEQNKVIVQKRMNGKRK